MRHSVILIVLISFDFYSDISARLDKEWWKHTLIYQLIPFSFKDSDGDGIGDIKGIISKLDYLVDIGIDTIQVTPIHKTTFRDMGYDISDYNSIDPRFGTMSDFDELMREMKKRNMKLLLDCVINHSGHEHDWFKKSIDRIDPYTDFYVWRDSKGYNNETGEQIPPNNWISVFNWGRRGSAWKWNEKRQQFYLHQFLDEQVDLNLSNKFLKQELKDMLKFWLDKGVAGFRLDAVIYFFEDKEFRDDFWERQVEQPETIEFVHELREFLDEYNTRHGGIERIFIAEAHTSPDVVRQFYDQGDYHVTHFPYTFELEYINGDITANEFHKKIDVKWLQKLPKHAVSTWAMHDHDVSRIGSRTRPEYMDIMTIVSMMLPGSAVCYYGQEIGMLNGYVNPDQIADFSENGSRDPHRLIMQWDDTTNAGFSTNTKTILPSNTDYVFKNVKLQKKQKISHYSLFKDLSKLRKTKILKYGDYTSLAASEDIYILTRTYKGHAFIVVVNFGILPSNVDLDAALPMAPDTISVVTASTNALQKKGEKLDRYPPRKFVMSPVSSVVFEAHNSHRN